jgi:hypothetical protein
MATEVAIHVQQGDYFAHDNSLCWLDGNTADAIFILCIHDCGAAIACLVWIGQHWQAIAPYGNDKGDHLVPPLTGWAMTENTSSAPTASYFSSDPDRVAIK